LHRFAEKLPQITVSSFLPFARMAKSPDFSRDFGFFVVICDFAYMVGIKKRAVHLLFIAFCRKIW